MERILEALTNQKLSSKLELEQANDHAELLDKYLIEPLMPNVPNKTCLISNNDHEKTKEELLTRLTYTLKKLHQYERINDLDKKQNTANVPCLDADSILSRKDLLPRNVEENINNIIESAQEYIAKLNYQIKDLDDADQQVTHALF